MSRFWILVLMSSLISDGFNCMVSSSGCSGWIAARRPAWFRSGPQVIGHRLQLALHRGVDHRIANDNPRAADEPWIEANRGLDFLAEAPLQRRLESRKLRLVDGQGAQDLRSGEAVGRVLERAEQLADFRQQREPVGFQQHADEASALGAEAVAADAEEKGFLRNDGQSR